MLRKRILPLTVRCAFLFSSYIKEVFAMFNNLRYITRDIASNLSPILCAILWDCIEQMPGITCMSSRYPPSIPKPSSHIPRNNRPIMRCTILSSILVSP